MVHSVDFNCILHEGNDEDRMTRLQMFIWGIVIVTLVALIPIVYMAAHAIGLLMYITIPLSAITIALDVSGYGTEDIW